MFRGLTPDAERALTVWAQATAQLQGARFVQPTHLLRAILDRCPDESEIALAVLRLARDQVVASADRLLPRDEDHRSMSDLRPSADTTKVIGDSAGLAEQHHRDRVGIGHLFCACLLHVSERLSLGWFGADTQGPVGDGAIIRVVEAFRDTVREDGHAPSPAVS